METRRKGEMGKTGKVSRIFLLLLVLLKITTPSSGINRIYDLKIFDLIKTCFHLHVKIQHPQTDNSKEIIAGK